MAQILIDGSVVVPNGPKALIKTTITVEAYDRVDVLLPAGSDKLEIEAPPGSADTTLFLLIGSDWYGPELSYQLDSGAGVSFVLDAPLLLAGKGAVSFYYSQKPKKLLFKNTKDKDANIPILVGRDATP